MTILYVSKCIKPTVNKLIARQKDTLYPEAQIQAHYHKKMTYNIYSSLIASLTCLTNLHWVQGIKTTA